MKVAILGFAGQGQAAYEYWNTADNTITVCDANADTEVSAGVATQLGDKYLGGLDQFDLLVRTPSLHPRDIVAANPDSPHILDKVTTVTNEFFRVCPSKKIIGVTGTKGKGTTSSLIAAILKTAGKRVHLGGNIGIPPLDMLKDNIHPNDWVVLELANFQLIDLKLSPRVAVCVMIAPEHLNWHADMDEYITTKQNLFRFQNVNDLGVFNRANAYSEQVASVSAAHMLSYEVPSPGADPHARTGAYLLGDTIYMDSTPVCKASDVALLGRHNLENVCAAIAATWHIIKQDIQVIQHVVRNFTGLPHRLEFVREVDGVKYYNDSFAAAPDAAMAAMNAIPGTKVVIMGGFDRQLPLDGLVHTVVSHQEDIRTVLLIGASAQRVAEALDTASFSKYEIVAATDIAAIIQKARGISQPGDSVILSPGFPSFDMFKNFEDRGLQFKAAVQAL